MLNFFILSFHFNICKGKNSIPQFETAFRFEKPSTLGGRQCPDDDRLERFEK